MKYLKNALALGFGAAMLAACNKEAVTPSAGAGPAPDHGHAKAPAAQAYAIYRMQWGTGLALFDPTHRNMTALGPIVDAATNLSVKYFKGISYDPIRHCTWLVTDNSTGETGQRSSLYRIDVLPTGPVASIPAVRVAALFERGTTPAVPVTDAKDIEFLDEAKIAMLRADADGNNARVTYLDFQGGTSHLWSVGFPGARALTTVSNQQVKVLSMPKNGQVPRLLTFLPYNGQLTLTQNFGFPEFAGFDAGIMPSGPTSPVTIGVDDMINAGVMVTSTDPDPHFDQTNVFATFDLTVVTQ